MVDTLYNRVVCDSIGASVDTLYSTPLTTSSRAYDEFRAQELALRSAAAARGIPVRSPGNDTKLDRPGPPEVRITAADAVAAIEFTSEVGKRTSDAFEAVIRASLTPEWRRSLSEISGQRQLAGQRQLESAAGVQRAVSAHLDRLATVLSPVLSTRRDAAGRGVTLVDVAVGTTGGLATSGVSLATAEVSWPLALALARKRR
jgi:hypothetical protein